MARRYSFPARPLSDGLTANSRLQRTRPRSLPRFMREPRLLSCRVKGRAAEAQVRLTEIRVTADRTRSKTWDSGWEERVLLEISRRGYTSASEFFGAHVGVSYGHLAQMLGENVAPVQLEVIHAGTSHGDDAVPRDSLARMLASVLRKGWGASKYWQSSATGAFAQWIVLWEQEAPKPANVKSFIFANPPREGWLPGSGDDPYLVSAFRAAWK